MTQIPTGIGTGSPLKLKLDIVHGHNMTVETGHGLITRCGLITNIVVPSGIIPASDALIQALGAQGMPQRGDSYPVAAYNKYFCRRHMLHAVSARQAIVEIIYEYYGHRTIRDYSSVQAVQTMVIPGTFIPIIVQWQDPTDPNSQPMKRLGSTESRIPLRHIEVTATIDHPASQVVLDTLGDVNKLPWYGYPKGYWMFDELEGEYMDDRNWRYRAVFTSKMVEDWSEYVWMEDERGLPIPVPDNIVTSLMRTPYVNDRIIKNGLTKVGNCAVSDFAHIFGFDASGSLPV